MVIVIICELCCFFFFKQKTAYEMRISDWSSDVCSSDLAAPAQAAAVQKTTFSIENMTCAMCPVTVTKAMKGVAGVKSVTEIGRAHVLTPVTNAHLVCRLLLEKKKKTNRTSLRTTENNITDKTREIKEVCTTNK